MIQSTFISDIVDLLLDGYEHEICFRSQIQFLIDSNFEYTGEGLFVNFTHSNTIEKCDAIKDRIRLNGVEIKSPELKIAAEAALIIANGVVDYLEIWSYDGNYPKKDLSNYTLTQVWIGSAQKQITKYQK